MPETFLVRLVRPVFQFSYLEVEAEDQDEAVDKALDSLDDNEIPEENWMGRYNPDDYDVDAYCVHTCETKDGNLVSLLDFPQYALLSTGEDSPYSAAQPWMERVLPATMACLFTSWINELSSGRTECYDGTIRFLEQALAKIRGSDEKVVPLQPPSERRQQVELLEAALDLSYTLKETD